MKYNFTEKELIFLLNSLCITLRLLRCHTLEEKQLLSFYFDFDDYYDNYCAIDLLYKTLSLEGNRVFYNKVDDIYFTGQKNYISYFDKKNFQFKSNFYKRKNPFIKLVRKLKK